MSSFGNLCMALALGVAVFALAFAVAGARLESRRLALASQRAVYAHFALVAAASFALVYMFLSHDFTNEYVWKHSDTTMPGHYLFAAWWGGMDGSMLFWAFWLSFFAAAATFVNRNKHRHVLPYAIATMMAVCTFFAVLLLFETNPFVEFLVRTPTDGEGLNPLLQNPTMVVHPPTLYLGFVGTTVPFAFAMGAMISGRLDNGWIKAIRRWTIVAWIFLSAGNLLGSWWAYTELGWGGVWAWDPVENAAFMPWLAMTAFLHSIMITERRGMMQVWNMVLVVVGFVLTLIGTSLTRSGVVSSVHAFAQSAIGHYFWIFTGIMLVLGIGLILYRLPMMRSPQKLDSLLSREFSFLLNNAILLAGTFVVLFGTLTPLLSELITGEIIEVGPPAFNRFMAPVGLSVMALMGIGPLIAWRKATPQSLIKTFAFPVIVGLIAVLGMLWWAIYDWFPLASIGICVFVVGTVVQEFWRGTAVRMKNTKEIMPVALVNLVARAKRRYGGYVVHIGIVLIFLGLTGLAFSKEREFRVEVGSTYHFYGYDLTLDSIGEYTEADRWISVAHVTVRRDGEEIAKLNPSRFVYRVRPDAPTTEVSVLSNTAVDLYLVLGNYDAGKTFANLKAYVNPLVLWLWLGGFVLLIGAVLGIWPSFSASPARVRARVPAQSAGAGGAMPEGAMARSRAALWIGVLIGTAALLGAVGIARAEAIPPSTASAADAPASAGAPGEVPASSATAAPRPAPPRPMPRAMPPSAPRPAPRLPGAEGVTRPRLPMELDPKLEPIYTEAEAGVFCSCGCRHILGDCGSECGPAPHLRAAMYLDVSRGMSAEEAVEAYVVREGAKFEARDRTMLRSGRAMPKAEGIGAVLYALPYVSIFGGIVLAGLIAGIWVRRGRAARVAAADSASRVKKSDADKGEDDDYRSRLRDELQAID